jgi:hypothetical protein
MHIMMLQMLLSTDKQGYQDLMKDACAFFQSHVNGSPFKRCAALIKNEISMAFINVSCMLFNEMRNLLGNSLSHEMAHQGFIEEFIAQDGL